MKVATIGSVSNPQGVLGDSSSRVARSLEEWVGEAVDALVGACHPLSIILFGSVARGDARWDSDIDLLVVVDDECDWTTTRRAAHRAVAKLVPEVDLVVTTQNRFEMNRDRAGTIIRPAVREGKIVYPRAA